MKGISNFAITIALMLGSMPLFAHVDEGTGNALQLFSYRLTGETPVIDGNIMSRNGNPSTEDSPGEWREAYTRKVDLSDGSEANLFIMNDADSLYFAVIYYHGNNAAGNTVRLLFDEGNGGGEHDNNLSTPGSNRNEAGYEVSRGGTLGDLSWNGSSWSADADGQQDMRAAASFFNQSLKAHHYEFAIPLNNGKAKNNQHSDLKVSLTDELGFYLEVIKAGSNAGTYHWTATNGQVTNPGAGAGWADLRLNVQRTCFTFYSSIAESGIPAIDGNLAEAAWNGSFRRDIILTNFNGDTVSANITSIMDPNSGEVYFGIAVNDPAGDAGNYLQLYFEENGSNATDTSRNYFLDNGHEDALRITPATYADYHWNSDWILDSEASDGHLGAAQHTGSGYVFEARVPYTDANGQDISIPTRGAPGLFLRYHDNSQPFGSRDYFWEFIANTDFVEVDPQDDISLAAGWATLQMGVLLSSLSGIQEDVCVSDSVIDPPIIIVDNSKLPTPQSNPGSGATFQSSLTVDFFLTGVDSPYTILYTTDGTDPDTVAGGGTLIFDPADPVVLFTSDTLKAIATKPGWLTSDVYTAVFTKISGGPASDIQILSAAGSSFQGNTLLSSATQYSIKLRTNEDGLAVYQPVITSSVDSEEPILTSRESAEAGYEVVYLDVFAHSGSGVATNNDNVLTTGSFDTLIVTWTNPRNPGDVARDTVYVQPADEAATIYFSRSASLSDTVSAFQEGDATVYVIVADQATHPDSTYQVTLNTNTSERETITLTQQGNLLVGQIAAAYDPINPGDGNLEVLLQGDVITATYQDVIYDLDVATKSVSYGAKSISPPVADVPDNAFFDTDTTIGLSTLTGGASIRYTDDGATDPAHNTGTLYTARIATGSTVIIKAVAYIKHSDTNFIQSSVVTLTYNLLGQVGLPIVIPPGPLYFTEDTTVQVIPLDPADSLIYTTDGSDPTVSGVVTDVDTLVLSLTGTTTLRVYARQGSPANQSGVRTEVYTKRDTLVPPIADPEDNTVFTGDTTVTLSHPEVAGVIIRYTLDGSEPNLTSPSFSLVNPIRIQNPTIIKAKAYNPLGSDAYVASATATFTYIPKLPRPYSVPGDTSFTTVLTVELLHNLPGVDIYFDVNGTDLSTLYGQQIRLTQGGAVRAVARKTGWADSDTLVAVYTKAFTPSNLKILDINRQETPYLTERNGLFYLVLESAEVDLMSADAVSLTLRRNDTETLTLTDARRVNGLLELAGIFPLRLGTGNASVNDTVQANYYDSLIATWINPNVSQDTARDTIRIRPAPQDAQMTFAESMNFDPITIYTTDVDTVYIVVMDQVWDPNETYTLTLTTEPHFGDRTSDTLTVPLVEISPGLYGAALPVDKTPVADPGDNRLQAVVADRLFARYQDPVDGDIQTATIIYGIPSEVSAQVQFVDANGSVLPGNTMWDPASDFVYLQYIDDYTDNFKSITLTTQSVTPIINTLRDTLVTSFDSVTRLDSIGIWHVTVPLSETTAMNTSDDLLQVYFRATATATVVSHDRSGLPAQTVQDQLIIARPDEDADLVVRDWGTGSDSINRLTDSVFIRLTDQDFGSEVDTLYVDVQCRQSGDVMTNVALIETDSGVYETVMDKNEQSTVNGDDSVLTCFANDEISVTYTDPVYETVLTVTRGWFETVETRLSFISLEENVITTWNESDGSYFKVRIAAQSPDRNAVDTLRVTLTTHSGDLLTVTAIESGNFSGLYFSDSIPFAFVSSLSTGNAVIEGRLNIESDNNSMDVQGVVTGVPMPDTAQLTIHGAYVPVEKAWIVDGNRDGAADTLFIQFTDALPGLPGEISNINWPTEGENTVTANQNTDLITFYTDSDGNVDSTLIIIVLDGSLDGSVFTKGLTSVTEGSEPSLVLPQRPTFGGVQVAIEDSMGAIITEIERKATSGDRYQEIDANGASIYKTVPDTVLVTLSEDLIALVNTCEAWDSLVMFSYANENGVCGDSVYFLKSIGCSEPRIIRDNGTFQLEYIVENELGTYVPRGSYCAWLNPDAPFTDLHNNNSVEVVAMGESNTSRQAVTNSRLFIPVLGQINSAQGQSIFHDLGEEGDNSRFIIPESNTFLWIPPAGFTSGGTQNMRDYETCDAGLSTQPDLVDYDINCLSSVLVFSDTGYTAEISIFDHLGKFIHRSTQWFGSCGELQDPRRQMAQGTANWLVWNTKDREDNFVGSGVYIWKVQFTSSDSRIKPYTAVYKQGISRSERPDGFCWD